MARHIILTDPSLNGLEYGMLFDFQNEICRVTDAQKVLLPCVKPRFGIGTRYQAFRQLLPKTIIPVSGDVIWTVLMGPENCLLDVCRLEQSPGSKRVLYLFDTLEIHIPAVKYILDRCDWDVLITSFDDAKAMLEKETGRKWHAIGQGVIPERFEPIPLADKSIGFCSYGRRDYRLHQAILDFSRQNNVYYDFTTWESMRGDVTPDQLYSQYAWHLRHAVFSVNLAVEITNPQRAGNLSPTTCRWFESAAAGSVMIGVPPSSPTFSNYFPSNSVLPIDLKTSHAVLMRQISDLWERRQTLHDDALHVRDAYLKRWTWENRVKAILELL
jgi:hypothetical protein